MAIVEMKKVTAIANTIDHERIMKLLVDFGVAEITESIEFDDTIKPNRTHEKETIESKLALLTFAINYIDSTIKTAVKLAKKGKLEYTKPKTDLFKSKITLSKEEFSKSVENEDSTFSLIREIEELNRTRIELTSDNNKHKVNLSAIAPYLSINLPFNAFVSTKRIDRILGLVKSDRKQIVNEIAEKFPNSTIIFDVENEKNAKPTPIVVLSVKEDTEEIMRELTAVDFVKCNIDLEQTPQEAFDKVNKEIKQNNVKILDAIKKSTEYYVYQDEFKILYDYYKLQHSIQEATEQFRFTRHTFAFAFWTPSRDVDKIKAMLDENNIDCYLEAEDPLPTDNVPTYTENNAIVSPYESITNMYSPPSYREKDPNTIMSIFYFLLFGIMLGDAAYGLLLAIGGFVIYLLKKPKKGEGKLLLVIAMGGISTAIWGFLFGSWFGITPDKSKLWYWFNPLEDPLMMLILSLGVGFLQIVVGMFLQSLKLFREHKPMYAIFNVYGWYVVFIGIGIYALNAFIIKKSALSTAGLVVAIVGVVMLLIGGALGKNKKFFSRVLGGFKNIYGVTNILSDVLSYARLFGLGLATGVVAMVVNQICSVIRGLLNFGVVGMILGWIVSIVIYVIGHVFNLAINTLGTYVHNCRLQYVEFYGRFYEGGGRIFNPLGRDKKYTYLE